MLNKKKSFDINFSFLSIVLFLLLFLLFYKNIIVIDGIMSSFLFQKRNIIVLSIFTFFSSFCDPLIIFSFMFLFSIYLAIINKKKFIILMFFSVLISGFSNIILKNIFLRPRPIVSYYIENGYSFPSGHSTIAVAFYGFIIYFLLSNFKNNKKINTSVFFIILLILLIGLSRIYLGAHYFSDVLGGFILGLSIFLFVVFIFQKLEKKF